MIDFLYRYMPLFHRGVSILNTEEMVILIVGDKKAVFEGISKLGYEVLELEYK